MIAVDTNLLVFAHRRDSQWHRAARQCLEPLAENSEPWAIPWPCFYEFFAIVTHPRIYRPATTIEDALAQIEALKSSPGLVTLSETGDYWPVLRGLLATSGVTGPTVHDARIAALCLHHGVTELWTADRDFSHFPSLKTRNPLLGVSPEPSAE